MPDGVGRHLDPADGGNDTMTAFDLSVTDALLSTTRAVRKRLDLERPVPREIVRDCLELAVQAPTGSNRQDWCWLVVTDSDRRRALADLYRRNATGRLATAHEAALAAGRDTRRPGLRLGPLPGRTAPGRAGARHPLYPHRPPARRAVA